MRVFHFSECPYPDAWQHADGAGIRTTFPNRHFDPVVGADLLHQRLDEWVIADELGLDIMTNEHRATSTCLSVSCMLPLAILARETKRARLLTLGSTIGVRHDPVQVAEELAYIDVVSRGRLEMGLVKGYSAEIAPANMNPVTLTSRYWEAHDLIIKAMTEHDGPFNWEGEHFHYRQVSIWPRPYQQPHPPVWVTCFTPGAAIQAAERGYVVGAIMSAAMTKAIFDAYRGRIAELGQPSPSWDRFAFACLIGVGRTEEEGYARLNRVRGWVTSSSLTPPHFGNPPGYMPLPANVKALRSYPNKDSMFTRATGRDGKTIDPRTCHPRELASPGIGFGGTPDQVFEQIKSLHDHVGGFGNLLAMMHGGDLSHKDTVDSMTLFAQEVLPRLRELPPSTQDQTEDLVRATVN